MPAGLRILRGVRTRQEAKKNGARREGQGVRAVRAMPLSALHRCPSPNYTRVRLAEGESTLAQAPRGKVWFSGWWPRGSPASTGTPRGARATPRTSRMRSREPQWVKAPRTTPFTPSRTLARSR